MAGPTREELNQLKTVMENNHISDSDKAKNPQDQVKDLLHALDPIKHVPKPEPKKADKELLQKSHEMFKKQNYVQNRKETEDLKDDLQTENELKAEERQQMKMQPKLVPPGSDI